MKKTKLKRLIKKMMDCVFLDAMTPEFKAANAELLKAIKMNDKSGAVPHADLEAINKAMKENDAEKVGTALKKVQLQLSKAEKALDDEVKDVNARLADAKQAGEKAKQELKAKKALEAIFEKAKSVCDSVKSNPKNASKLTALTDKLRDYGDLSKRASQIVTLSASGKDASKQVDMLRKSIDTAEKKYKKDLANIEKEARKAKDALEVMAMRQKVTQGKRDAFQKERLYLANAVKQIPQGDLRQEREPNETDSFFKQQNEAIRFIENDIAKEMKRQIDLMKKKQKEYYSKTKDYSEDIKEASGIKERLLSGIKEIIAKNKELGLSPKVASVVNNIASLVKKGNSNWDSPDEVKSKILRSVGKNYLSLSKEKQNEFKAKVQNIRDTLAIYQKFIFRGDLERARQLLTGGRNDIVDYMNTPEGNDAYQDAFMKIGSLCAKIRQIFPHFDPPREINTFKWDYFKNSKPFINGLISAVKNSERKY